MLFQIHVLHFKTNSTVNPDRLRCWKTLTNQQKGDLSNNQKKELVPRPGAESMVSSTLSALPWPLCRLAKASDLCRKRGVGFSKVKACWPVTKVPAAKAWEMWRRPWSSFPWRTARTPSYRVGSYWARCQRVCYKAAGMVNNSFKFPDTFFAKREVSWPKGHQTVAQFYFIKGHNVLYGAR